MNEILVTGATSYIGKHCIAVLAEKGYKVRTTIRDIKKADQVKFDLEDYLGKTIDLEFHETDLMKEDGWFDAIKGCDAIIHLSLIHI